MKPEVEEYIRQVVNSEDSDDPFRVLDVEDVLRKHKRWAELLPRVTPFYAVKANPMPPMLDLLASLGIGFDCASQREIQEMVARGATRERIIFANPVKRESMLRYAKSVGIDMMTFDTEEELSKIHRLYPAARLVLRIKVDDSTAVCKLGLKFGVELDAAEDLLKSAKKLGMNVIGIAFHIGCLNDSGAAAWRQAIRQSRTLFDVAAGLGFHFHLLDIGGGFSGYLNLFEDMITDVRDALDEYFPESSGVTLIAEPGRYYAVSSCTTVTKIIAKKVISNDNQEKLINYYLNDGVYGSYWSFYLCLAESFYNILTKVQVDFQPLNPVKADAKKYPTRLWGPTCDSFDMIPCVNEFTFPELNTNDYILGHDLGAYTHTFAEFGFNGMPGVKIKTFVSTKAELELKKLGVTIKTDNLDYNHNLINGINHK